ncbi:MAG: glycerol kinase [Cyanobacteria bacterium P01_A01_bin.116]
MKKLPTREPSVQGSSVKGPSKGLSVKKLSTTALSKALGLSAKALFAQLLELQLIQKAGDDWVLTAVGIEKGGDYKVSKRFGKYIVWPENIELQADVSVQKTSVYSTVIRKGAAKVAESVETFTSKPEALGFREKFKAEHRSADGHFVRSKAEMLIDNWLYMAEIAHAYERKLPIEETVYSDFYIPAGKVYIEYWGYKNNPKYLARKQTKLSLYEKYGFNLIELNDKDVQNLDDVLPRWLLKYGVQAY